MAQRDSNEPEKDKTPLARAIQQERDDIGYTEQKDAPWDLEAEGVIKQICERFPKFVSYLPNRIDIRDEEDVQDILNALLRVHFDDVRSEEPTPSQAGRFSKIDFLLKEEKIGIEVKKTSEWNDAGELGKQLAIDKEGYKSHPDFELLICFVYNHETKLENPQELSDLEDETGELSVKVVVSPRR